MADSPNLRALARQLADMRRRQDRQEQASNSEQLKYSSLDDGSVVEKDASGSIVSRWGKQHDGTHGTAILNGPTPPVPTAPTVDGTAGSLTVTWDGSFPGDRRVPLDFQTVQIGVGAPDGDLSMVGVITSEAGGSKSLSVDPGDYDVALRSRAASGRMSAWSTPTRATVEPVVDPEVIARLEGAFTTSTEAPTPADGQDKPEGAYWTQIDGDGAQVARWRWVDGAWVDAPIAVEFIPEAYIDFLAANEAFIADMRAEIVTSDVFQGREFIGGTFTGTRFEGAEVDGAKITGGSLNIEGALTANPEDGVRIGGTIPVHQHPEVQAFPGSTTIADLTDNSIPPGEDIIVRVKIERTPSYQYGGQLEMGATTFLTLVAEIDDIPLIGEGEVREYRVRSRRGILNYLRFRRNPVDSDLGTPAGEIEFSELEILTPSTGDITMSGQVSANEGVFSSLTVGGAPMPSVVLLDSITMSGNIRDNGDVLTVPEHLRGTFRKYEIEIIGGSDVPASGVQPVIIFINNDRAANYRTSSKAEDVDGTVRRSQNYGATAFPFHGYVGRWESRARITFTPTGLGNVALVEWTGEGWGNDGAAGGFLWRSGGRWLPGGLQPIEYFLIDTNNSTANWATTARATLWGYK